MINTYKQVTLIKKIYFNDGNSGIHQQLLASNFFKGNTNKGLHWNDTTEGYRDFAASR